MTDSLRRNFLTKALKATGGLVLLPATSWAMMLKEDIIHRSARIMGMAMKVSIPSESFTSARVEAAFGALRRVDGALTVFGGEGALMRLNAYPGKWVAGSMELQDVAAAALRWGEWTDGALDVTVLPVMRRMGLVPGADVMAGAGAGVAAALGLGRRFEPTAGAFERIDFTKLQVRKGSVRLAEAGFGVDFGGIAKGYGVDEAIRALRAKGVRSAVVDGAGDVFAMGRPEKDRLWRIGIPDPDNARRLIAVIEAEDEAVATSGIGDGHLINPKTGLPVRHVVQATILAPDTMTADALATATSVMVPTAARGLVEDLPGVEGFWIFADSSHSMTQGMKSRLSWMR